MTTENLSIQNLSIQNLSYEELVLIQEIMMDVWEYGIATDRTKYDQRDFDSLYEKVMKS